MVHGCEPAPLRVSRSGLAFMRCGCGWCSGAAVLPWVSEDRRPPPGFRCRAPAMGQNSATAAGSSQRPESVSARADYGTTLFYRAEEALAFRPGAGATGLLAYPGLPRAAELNALGALMPGVIDCSTQGVVRFLDSSLEAATVSAGFRPPAHGSLFPSSSRAEAIRASGKSEGEHPPSSR